MHKASLSLLLSLLLLLPLKLYKDLTTWRSCHHAATVVACREDGIFVEDAYRVPGVAAVAEGFAGHPEDVYLNPDKEFDIREFVKMGLWPQPGTVVYSSIYILYSVVGGVYVQA